MENTADFYELFSNLATYGAFMPIPQEPLLEECQSEENAYTECGKEKESREHARNVETVARLNDPPCETRRSAGTRGCQSTCQATRALPCGTWCARRASDGSRRAGAQSATHGENALL